MQRHFKPPWWATLGTLVLLPVFLSLGFWQLQRGDYRQSVADSRAQNAELDPVALEHLRIDAVNAVINREVYARGEFDSQRQYVLANKTYRGAPGFWVLTPFKLDASTAVLVNRGWVAQSGAYEAPQSLPPPDNLDVLNGRLARLPVAGLAVGTPGEAQGDWPRLLVRVEQDWLEHQLGLKLLPVMVLQQATGNKALVRDWDGLISRQASMTPEKHYGYALQWFSLALLLIGLYVGLNLKKRVQS